ncbi:LOW QUALITY PROTEIN: fatty acyl-CoA hydrolase precursor, medium chain-like [Salarias fasciatus]|uniref:LOW QUALITY PROTEIN: fatty acyl-CoA hydrolase precursor, medium chain-like n=1 Tax=Salarias fasciatus TaxID=181472 RepID=UPI001176D8B2|nr:LOW QUALITY PROTEIN: fatty acyl-CoA hydrolase precursor, medium chain-like [Salarias fasciatus]
MCVLFADVAADLEAPEVHTELGSLKGQYVTVKGTEAAVHAFLGVPFAKPPVGPSLRLAAPQPVEGWKGVRDATKQPAMCIQNKPLALVLIEKFGTVLQDIPGISEDCLYLNIYTPADRAPDAQLPVMVWIHGGGFTLGSVSSYDGSALAAYQDVVVVLIQYRLGLLGFLSTGDEHMSGNFGLLDQIQALKWIQQYIHNFGGNPNLVTIFGESAGGVSVCLLLLSPLSKGLFHRAISQSGPVTTPLLRANHPLPATQVIANASGCSLESTKKIGECMRNLDSDAIVAVVKDEKMGLSMHADGHFLTKPVNELLQSHEILTVPFMIGVNNDEMGWMLPDFFDFPQWREGFIREQIVNMLSGFFSDPKDAVMPDLLLEEYIGIGEDPVKNRAGLTEALGDLLFTIPAITNANAHRDAGATVFLYEFQHPIKFQQEKRPSFVKSDHTDEIPVVLGFCFTTAHVTLTHACSEEEEHLSRTMMSYWANFARTGSPNGDGLALWPKYGAEEQYLAIGLKEQVAADHLKEDRFVFITRIIPEKVSQLQQKTEHSEL